jgi:hypothetical protein
VTPDPGPAVGVAARGGAGDAAGDAAAPTIREAAARVGAYRWAEQRLFHLTGEWAGAPSVSDSTRVHLFEMSAQHAWHAELWAQRLPVLAGMDPDRLTRPLGSMGPVLTAVGLGEADERDWLTGLYRVALPRLLVTYRDHLARVAPVAEAPVARALALVVRDEHEQLLAGEALLQGLLVTADGVRRAAELQRALETLLVGTGAGAGYLSCSGGIFPGESPRRAPAP